MRNSNQAILSALERDHGGVAIIWCPMDVGLRDWLINEVESLADPEARPFQTDSVEAAFAQPDALALLIPGLTEEREVVLDLNGSRDRIFNEDAPRTQPIVLFLFRGGEGQVALAQSAPSLRSITGGSDPDPEALAEIDVDAAVVAFEQETGQTPAEWLALWQAGRLLRSGPNYALMYQAALLEDAQ